MEQQSVKVYIYDLSRGMARSMSGAFLGEICLVQQARQR